MSVIPFATRGGTAPMLAAALLFAAPAAAQSPQEAAEKLASFLDRFPDLGPGYAVVVVTPDEVLLRDVRGVRKAGEDDPLTTDTPLYIASQTKAYVGLLAARLDAEGILALDDRITDHWPDVEFPGDVDPEMWSLRDLLAHNVPIECGYVTTMEAYVTELASSDYPALLATHAIEREEGFRYDNLGYNVWGAILETATGKSWRTWLDEKLFEPLALERTSSRTSDFALDELSWSHIWQGPELGWFPVRPKTDPMMQSAGGLVTSVDDMATFLQVQLKGGVLADSGLTEAIVSEAQAEAAFLDPDEPNPYELPCSAYALGWNVCDFEGHTLYIHGGGYTGARTMMAFAPELGVGIAVFSNSDNMTGWLTSRTIVQYLQYLTEHPDADRMSDVRARVYPQRIQRLLDGRIQDRRRAQDDERWGDWSWEPGESELRSYVGSFESDDPYLTAEVTLEDGQLWITVGGTRAWLIPAVEDLFGSYTDPFSGPEPMQWTRDDAGAVTGFTWQDVAYGDV